MDLDPLPPPLRPQVLCQAYGVSHAAIALHMDKTVYVADSYGAEQTNPWGISTCPWVQMAPHPTPLVCPDMRVRRRRPGVGRQGGGRGAGRRPQHVWWQYKGGQYVECGKVLLAVAVGCKVCNH
jgi:hypothetical protein